MFHFFCTLLFNVARPLSVTGQAEQNYYFLLDNLIGATIINFNEKIKNMKLEPRGFA